MKIMDTSDVHKTSVSTSGWDVSGFCGFLPYLLYTGRVGLFLGWGECLHSWTSYGKRRWRHNIRSLHIIILISIIISATCHVHVLCVILKWDFFFFSFQMFYLKYPAYTEQQNTLKEFKHEVTPERSRTTEDTIPVIVNMKCWGDLPEQHPSTRKSTGIKVEYGWLSLLEQVFSAPMNSQTPPTHTFFFM